jgi:hypothetical protein
MADGASRDAASQACDAGWPLSALQNGLRAELDHSEDPNWNA